MCLLATDPHTVFPLSVYAETCDFGVPGIQAKKKDSHKEACCPRACGTCGGSDCNRRDGGIDCCIGSIYDHYASCEFKPLPPCAIVGKSNMCSLIPLYTVRANPNIISIYMYYCTTPLSPHAIYGNPPRMD